MLRYADPRSTLSTPGGPLSPETSSTNRWLILVIACLAQFMVVLDNTIVNVALPQHSAWPALLARKSAVGREWLHPDLRRLPDARRPRGRPARAPAPVHRRRGAVRRRLVAQRRGPVIDDADPRPWPAGPWRRAGFPRRALDHHDHLPGQGRAHSCAGRLVGDRRRRRGLRTVARRRPHRSRLLALELLRERPGRDRDRDARAPLCAGIAG